MANLLDETQGPINDNGRDIHVIDRQLPVTITFKSTLFEIALWVTIPVLTLLYVSFMGNKRVSRNLVGINFRHPNVMPNFAVWKTITYRHWHKWCCQPRF